MILKYSENLWWGGVKKSLRIGAPSGLSWNNFNISVNYPITVFSETKVLKDSVMRRYFKTGKNLLRNAGNSISISDAFDIKKLDFADNNKDKENFILSVNEFDRVRGTNFHQTFPELKPYWDYCKDK